MKDKVNNKKNINILELTQNEKMRLSIALLGGEKYIQDFSGYDHIPKTLKKHKLSYLEAISILKAVRKGHHNPTIEEKRIEPTIEYLKSLHKIEKDKKTKIHTEEHKKKDLESSSKNSHTKIFIDENFKLWERLKDEFKITESTRTDIRFIFESMKRDGFMHEHITQKQLLEWLNNTYEMCVGKLPYTNIKSSSNKARASNYSNICKLYKRSNN